MDKQNVEQTVDERTPTNADVPLSTALPAWVQNIVFTDGRVNEIKRRIVEYPGFRLIDTDDLLADKELVLPFLMSHAELQKKDSKEGPKDSPAEQILMYEHWIVIPKSKVHAFMDWYYEKSGMPLGGRDFMFDIIRQRFLGVSRKDIQAYLNKRKMKREFVLGRRLNELSPLIANRPMQIWVMKLVDMDYEEFNPGVQHSRYPYMGLIQDAFTKYVWAAPIRTSSQRDLSSSLCAFQKRVERDISRTDLIADVFGTKPLILLTNTHPAFTSPAFDECIGAVRKQLLPGQSIGDLPHIQKDQVIHIIQKDNSLTEHWENIITRMIGSHLSFSSSDTTTLLWDDVLQDIIRQYNETPHPTTEIKPYVAYKKTNWAVIKERIREESQDKSRQYNEEQKAKRQKKHVQKQSRTLQGAVEQQYQALLRSKFAGAPGEPQQTTAPKVVVNTGESQEPPRAADGNSVPPPLAHNVPNVVEDEFA